MKILKSYKTELDPNNKQKTLLKKHCDATRFAYNFSISRKIQCHKEDLKSPSCFDLQKEIVVLKKSNPWMREVSSCAFKWGVENALKAFDNFFRRVKEKKGKPGYPKFKSRYTSKSSTALSGHIHIYSTGIKLPVIGKIRVFDKNYLPTSGVKIKGASISERVGKWFVSVLVEEEIEEPNLENRDEIIGIDLGIKTLATLSDGTTFQNPKALRSRLKALKRKGQQLSRKRKGSKNREKAKQKLAKLHYKISCIRNDVLHKVTSSIIAKTKLNTIVVEDLNVKGMLQNRKLSRSISDVSFGIFLGMLKYKASRLGIEIIVADRFYPSSKTCPNCGHVKKELSLGERIYHCFECNFEIDRDLNAAINLRNLGIKVRLTKPNLKACGLEVRLTPVSILG